MKAGGRLKRALAWLFALSWIFLLLWSFQDVRFWARLRVMALLGFGGHPGIEGYDAMVAVQDFRPATVMRPAAESQRTVPAFETIEFHGHLFRDAPPPDELLAKLDAQRTRYFVNLALTTTTLAEFRELKAKYDSPRILHFVGFNWKYLREGAPDWAGKMARDLDEVAGAGVRGVKLWKNFGVLEKDPDGKILALDDPRLDPVWDVCARRKLLIAMHTADPPAFYRPANATNERLPELAEFPERSLHHSAMPAFDETMERRERLFARRRDVRFVALHFGEFAHDLRRAAELLDRNPNVWLDIAQRHDELGRQPRAARAFLIKYRTRILYGTDGLPDFEKVRVYWRFLETADEYFDYHPPHKPTKGIWKIYGLELPDEVLRDIYYNNAARLLGL